MADASYIDDLLRRVDRDPTSIAFAQLAEELRRAGELERAADICRAGLAVHPDYISARVTLARALAGLGRLEDAEAELERVLRAAPENLAANRELAGIYRRRGNPREGLARYRAALSLAPNDPELQHVVAALSLEVGAVSPAEVNAPAPAARVNVELGRTVRTIAALEQFLAAARLAP